MSYYPLERKILFLGTKFNPSPAITIPIRWFRASKLKKGDRLKVIEYPDRLEIRRMEK